MSPDEPDDGPVLPGDAPTDYERYLRVEELLGVQKDTDELNHHDERLFQTVHQTAELWFHQALFEMETAAERIAEGEIAHARRLIDRATWAIRVTTEQIHILETMNPWDFHAIRRGLGRGSGAESPGFRKIVERVPAVYGRFEALLEEHGVELEEVYTDADDHPELFDLAESLTDFDMFFSIWRTDHLGMIKRVIGREVKSLQGYTVHRLEEDVQQHLFPELWEVRNRLTEQAGTSPE